MQYILASEFILILLETIFIIQYNIIYKNISDNLICFLLISFFTSIVGLDPVGLPLEDGGDYRALSSREQHDLELLMAQSESAVSNAEAFADQLSKDLSVLDGANIHSMMASEAQVIELNLQYLAFKYFLCDFT